MPSNPNELLGTVVGGYRLDRILGAGATGAVFLGQRADQPAQPVAVKVLLVSPQASEAERELFQERFRREAQALLGLQHPNIPKLLAFGIEQDYDYLVLQYIDGGSLYTRLAQGPLRFDEIARYFQQLSNALDFAHANKLIHRDIKPANVLLDSTGNAYLADFSIAQLFEPTPQQQKLTSTGQAIGTPEYMSPEQMRGQQLDDASDIYSLGLLVYQMVTGKPPFQGNSFGDLTIKHVTEQPPYPRAMRQDLPSLAERAIMKALAKNPTERFQTAGQFYAAFTTGLNTADAPAPVGSMMGGPSSGGFIAPTGMTGITGASTVQYPPLTPSGMPPAQQTNLPAPYSGQRPPTTNYQTQMQAPRGGTATPILIGVIVVLVLAMVGAGIVVVPRLIAGAKTQATTGTGNNPTATGFSANPTATTSGSSATATPGVTATSTPSTSDYAASQPGPGCDTGGGTWTPKRIDKITCGTQLYIYATQVYGYLSFQLPGSKAFAPNNIINITGNPISGNAPAMCVGLAETDGSNGYMADYCGDGTWNIYEISGAGANVKTYQTGVTSTRQSTNISLTLKGSSLTFMVDTETHTVNNLQRLQPTSVAIVYYNGNNSGTCCYYYNLMVNNFGYTVLTT